MPRTFLNLNTFQSEKPLKKQPSTPEVCSQIREIILSLPPDQRRRLSDELLSFLLFDRQALTTPGGVMNNEPSKAGLTAQQLHLIKSLGEHTRRLNEQAGDDLYFFM